jgi:hypothetical protein
MQKLQQFPLDCQYVHCCIRTESTFQLLCLPLPLRMLLLLQAKMTGKAAFALQ